MPVSYSVNQENTRFIRHKFLSLSPTSTTIYERTFDLQLNKYHVPIRVNEETGEIIDNKPPVFERHKGTLSDKGRRNLNRSVYTLLASVNENLLLSGEGKENITFATFTLASSQIKNITQNGIEYYATDKEIKRNCFNQLLIELKQTHSVDYNVWVAEKQLNGSIHFHVLLDRRIDYSWLRSRWNFIQNKYGFVDRYQSNMIKQYGKKYNKISRNKYFLFRCNNDTSKVGFNKAKKIINAYKNGLSTSWSNPNSTDIESLRDIENVASYLSKYMSKGYGHTDNEMKQQISKIAGKMEINDIVAKSFYQIEGRIWQCTQNISKARKCIIEAEDTMLEELTYMQTEIKNLKVFVEDRFTTVLHKFMQLFTHTNEIYHHYVNHIKAHYFNNIRYNLFDTDYSPCGVWLSPEPIQAVLPQIIQKVEKYYQPKISF
jgi:hypothetical protein